MSEPKPTYHLERLSSVGTLQKIHSDDTMPIEDANLHRARLEKMERQMIPLLNSIRQELGKPPIIVPHK